MRLLTEILTGILLPAAVVWLALKIGIMNVILISILVWVAVKVAHWWLTQKEIKEKNKAIINFIEKKLI
jgi:hypothetical protein